VPVWGIAHARVAGGGGGGSGRIGGIEIAIQWNRKNFGYGYILV
jgi:hypothetical protein